MCISQMKLEKECLTLAHCLMHLSNIAKEMHTECVLLDSRKIVVESRYRIIFEVVEPNQAGTIVNDVIETDPTDIDVIFDDIVYGAEPHTTGSEVESNMLQTAYTRTESETQVEVRLIELTYYSSL